MSIKKRTLPPSDTADKFVLRLPDGMRERIKTVADRNNRSMNAEIISTLESAYPAVMTFTDFMRDWVAPITVAKTQEGKQRLVDAANEEAKTKGVDYRVGLDAKELKPYVLFTGEDIHTAII